MSRGLSKFGRVAQLGEHLLGKQSNSQAMSLPRLRLGESSVPLAAPILLQEVSNQLLAPMCGRRQKIRFKSQEKNDCPSLTLSHRSQPSFANFSKNSANRHWPHSSGIDDFRPMHLRG